MGLHSEGGEIVCLSVKTPTTKPDDKINGAAVCLLGNATAISSQNVTCEVHTLVTFHEDSVTPFKLGNVAAKKHSGFATESCC